MFQSFDLPPAGDAAARFAALRAQMAAAGVDAFLAPRADAHQGETVAPRDQRLAWLTGFTGSAGLCVVMRDRAALFVDGRYTLQAAAQTDGALVEVVALETARPEAWIGAALSKGARLGYDPMLHTTAFVDRIDSAAASAGAETVALEVNPLDAAWADQPPPPGGAIRAHDVALTGESSAEKRARLAAALAEAGTDAALLTLPDSIAWLLNIRGEDVARTPAPLAFALLRADATVTLFVEPDRIDGPTQAHLGNAVAAVSPEAFPAALDALAGATVQVDRDSAPAWAARRLEAAGATVRWGRDPCVLPKACKTEAEIAGARAAHLRDAAAMATFLHWLHGAAPSGDLTEIDVVKQLEAIRARDPALRDIAFETICGAGEHGAIVHYRVTRETNRPVKPGELLLIDSGAQYPDGTTDVTRTVAVGPPPPDAARLFTLVLKGMIAVAAARFPEGARGRDIDPLARAALWAAGHDYDHGTGHGVGSYLGVHEGPQNISKRGAEPLRPGMIVSDEPGCYLEGRFGIRIENLLLVTPPSTPDGGARPMLGFETLTLAPIDRALIAPELLTAAERAWLDAYHARVEAAVSPLVEAPVAAWLSEVCRPL